MSRHESRLHPLDVAVLGHLSERGNDYPARIAYRQGVDPADVRLRCDVLADDALVEQVTHEPVYRITEAGLQRLTARRGTDDGSSGTGQSTRPVGDQ